MQWSSRQPFVPPSILDRALLRRAALRYAAHGWAVTPGAHLTGDRFDCGRTACDITGCHPALDSWAASTGDDPARISAWWRRRPYTVLLPTGDTFDALEVPASLGTHGPASGPVAVTAAGRWIFLVRPGSTLRPELEHRLDVVRHGAGSWIPAPPSRMPEGPVRWEIHPARTQWRLPASDEVQDRLAAALGSTRAAGPILVPRQLSRRAA
ncbi:DNA primase [Actinoplanes philippinensis]|uniref:Bifunctional DNA primase/polymerase, N-terminal n=1 Tax=Actinoplanes philippinensis TaxID=35752 RepID=A0A1I2BZE6_9ACTN|nr:bifunctional DNA primase/polymerase [Actinoplanes philippinensis]GIE76190.1 DNA primase [Actinoplanes philippinensis]SFE61268.1 Bifunctional DNA primase/polymerase, N-terminal [Actinoplanes philippinensis]